MDMGPGNNVYASNFDRLSVLTGGCPSETTVNDTDHPLHYLYLPGHTVLGTVAG